LKAPATAGAIIVYREFALQLASLQYFSDNPFVGNILAAENVASCWQTKDLPPKYPSGEGAGVSSSN
jgi:hypothetical protein